MVSRNNFYALIPHPLAMRFLILPGEAGWRLPLYQPAARYTPQVEGLNLAMRDQLGVEVTTLMCAHLDLGRASEGDVNALFVMENHSPAWTPSARAHWATRRDLETIPLEQEWQRPIIERWFEEETSGIYPALRPPWSRKGWRDLATEWTRSQLAGLGVSFGGPLVQVKQWDISSVWRAPTPQGDFYFKATPALYAHEPLMSLGLARLFPEHIPSPVGLATYPDQGWMLLRSFQGEILWTPSISQKEDILRITARMQVEASAHIDDLLAVGCVDFRLHTLPTRVADLSRDDAALARLSPAELEQLSSLLPTIGETCASLAAGPIPQSLMHGDLNCGNVSLHEGHYTIFDWTDGCVTHPFFDMVTFLEPADPDFAHLRDVYLAEWTDMAPLDTLRATFDTAYRLGGLHHALSYRTINAMSEAPMRMELDDSFEYFLRRYLSPAV